MRHDMNTFLYATRANGHESKTVLSICNGDYGLATELFSLFPREIWTALPDDFIYMLSRFPSDIRNKFLNMFLQFFPRDVFQVNFQGFDKADGEYMCIIALRVFFNTNKDANYPEQFAKTFQLGKAIMLPLFQEWARELQEMEKVAADSLERAAARERLKLLLDQTLPSVVEANPVFSGIAEDVVNLKMACDNGVEKTALRIAAKLGDIDLVNYLLERNARFDVKDSADNTMLHAGVDHPNIVETLLNVAQRAGQHDQFVQASNQLGETALHLCSNVESVRLLLRAAPSLLFAKDKNHNTAIHFKVNIPEVVEALLEAVEDEAKRWELVQQSNNKDKTALHLCNNAVSARLLLQICPSLVFARDNTAGTVLHWQVDHTSMVEALLEVIEDAEEMEEFTTHVDFLDRTALHYCTNSESARLLLQVSPALLFKLDMGGNSALHLNVDAAETTKVLLSAAREAGQLQRFIERVNKKGQTTLHLCQNQESARLLLSVSPGLVFSRCKAGNTPLHMLAIYGLGEFCRVLIEEYGADVNAANENGQTPLHFACMFRQPETASLLLQKSAQMLARDNEQCNVLHYAQMEMLHRDALRKILPNNVPRRHLPKPNLILELLLKQDKRTVAELVEARDKYGRTALHFWAQFRDNGTDVADMLIVAGANGMAQDKMGNTPMHLAAKYLQTDFVMYLIKHWALPIYVKNASGEAVGNYYGDSERRRKIKHASVLACAVTLRLAARPGAVPNPWKRLPRELFGELCSFLV